MRLLRSLACIPAIGRYRCCPGEHDHRTAWTRRAETDCTLSTERRRTTRGRRPEPAGQPVVIEDLTAEHRIFLAREWRGVDRALFGREVDWVSRPVTVETRQDGTLIGVASGEVVAGMARLHDLLVTARSRDRGLGRALVREFCAQAAALGASRCFLRCPATERHARFYEGLGFIQVARIPRYYHDLDFLEYMREPLP